MATVVQTGVFIDKDMNKGSLVGWYMVEHLRDRAGWLVAGSSNGTSGGMGFDYISSPNSFNSTNSWVVIEPPNGSFQVLWTRGASNNNFDCYFNPNSDYIGGSVSVDPTSATSFLYSTRFWASATYESEILHITAETEEPFGFTVATHNISMVSIFSTAVFPLENANGHSYIYFGGPSLSTATLSNYNSNSAPSSVDKNNSAHIYPTMLGISGTSNFFPLKVGSDDTGKMFRAPIVFGACIHSTTLNSGFHDQYKGICRYANWAGTNYEQYTTIENRSYIKFQDILVPWDGITIPLIAKAT